MCRNLKRKEKNKFNNLYNNRQRKYFNEYAETWDQNVYHDPSKLEKIWEKNNNSY